MTAHFWHKEEQKFLKVQHCLIQYTVVVMHVSKHLIDFDFKSYILWHLSDYLRHLPEGCSDKNDTLGGSLFYALL